MNEETRKCFDAILLGDVRLLQFCTVMFHVVSCMELSTSYLCGAAICFPESPIPNGTRQCGNAHKKSACLNHFCFRFQLGLKTVFMLSLSHRVILSVYATTVLFQHRPVSRFSTCTMYASEAVPRG